MIGFVLWQFYYCITNSIIFFMIALVAVNFFGYSITLTKKRVIVITIIMSILIEFNLNWHTLAVPVMFPKVYSAMSTGILYEGVMDDYRDVSGIITILQRVVFYSYAAIAYYILFEGKKLRQALTTNVLLFSYFFYSEFMMKYAYLYLTGGKWESHQEILYGYGPAWVESGVFTQNFMFVFSSLVLAVMYFGFYRKKRSYVTSPWKLILIVLWMVVFICMPYDVMSFSKGVLEKQYSIMSFHFGWMVVVLGFIAPLIMILAESAKYLKKENQFQKRYLEAELEYIERYKETQQQTRAFRHDMINQLSVATMLLEEGKVEKAGEQLQMLLGEVQSLSQQFVTGDEMLDCIVSMKAEKMKGMGISFSADGVADGGLHLKATEICSIFANALDNSIEAVEDLKDPKISMEIKKTEQFLVINIANSIREKVNVEKLLSDIKYTSKKDKDSHGFGFGNIKRVVENNNGMVKAKSSNDTFFLSIMLPREQKAS